MANKRTTTLFAVKAVGLSGLCVLSGIIGASLTRDFGTIQNTMTYSDFISIMLTAVSALMTVLAIFLAVLGLVGWTTIEQKVHTKTEDFLAKGFKPGGAIEQKVHAETEDFLAKGFEDGGRLNRMVADMVEKKTEQTMFKGVQPVGEEEDEANKSSPQDFEKASET